VPIPRPFFSISMATETSLSLRDVVAHLLKTHPLICTDTHSHAESVSRVTFTHSKNNSIKNATERMPAQVRIKICWNV